MILLRFRWAGTPAHRSFDIKEVIYGPNGSKAYR